MHNAIMENPELSLNDDATCLSCGGVWTLATVDKLSQQVIQLQPHAADVIMIDASDITELDTAGALLLHKITILFSVKNKQLNLHGLSTNCQSILDLVTKQISDAEPVPEGYGQPNWVNALGRWGVDKINQGLSFLNFTGETTHSFWSLWQRFRDFRWGYVWNVLMQVGCGSLPIVALMSFLVGIVLSYQLAEELSLYGADIYVVDASGIAILREFAPLITAIILAGKTSTAFAALIGAMKINEEIDALITMGISPIQRLVLPRVLALLIAMPLLTVWGSVFGIMGSMLLARLELHISFIVFLQRFADMVALKQYVLGMIKTPVFAFIIAIVGCFQGFQVGASADSVGKKTTQAAVQSIFLIIIADAFFSVLYSWEGL